MTDTRIPEMVRLRLEEGLTLQQIGDRFGITRERVRQLITVQTKSKLAEQTLAHKAMVIGIAIEEGVPAAARRTGHERSRIYQWCKDVGATPAPARQLLGHGTFASYQRGCKCESCRAANRAHRQKYVGRPVPPGRHGLSGYMNWKCKCDVCKAAGAVHNKESRQRRLAKLARQTTKNPSKNRS